MKKSFIILGLLFGTVTASPAFSAGTDFTISPTPATLGAASTNKELLAVSGCCKERKSTDDPWRKTRRNLDSCKKLNDEKDKDNVFNPNGLFWWDIAC